jgi:hypothetical protein
MIIVILMILAILFFPFNIEVINGSRPYTNESCNTISDCTRGFSGLKPTDCAVYNGKKVCWYGGSWSMPPNLPYNS